MTIAEFKETPECGPFAFFASAPKKAKKQRALPLKKDGWEIVYIFLFEIVPFLGGHVRFFFWEVVRSCLEGSDEQSDWGIDRIPDDLELPP